jgi:Transposase
MPGWACKASSDMPASRNLVRQVLPQLMASAVHQPGTGSGRRYDLVQALRLSRQRWINFALRNRIPAFVNLARQIRRSYDHIIAAVKLGLSNARLEGINAKIRLSPRH